jgi:hypothetical protein
MAICECHDRNFCQTKHRGIKVYDDLPHQSATEVPPLSLALETCIVVKENFRQHVDLS